MKRKILYSVILTVFAAALCHTQSIAQQHEKNNLLSERQTNARVFSAIANKHQVNGTDLQQFQKHLQIFLSVLEKKLRAADAETRSRFTGILEPIDNVLKGPVTPAEPGTGIFGALEMIVSEVGNNAVMAMVHEESMRHADKVAMATIRPNKGHGATYRASETVQLAVTALQESFIQIFFLSTPRNGGSPPTLQQLLFSPAPGKRSVSLASGDTLILGEDGSFVVQPPYGTDLIIVAASKQPLEKVDNTDIYQVSYPVDFSALFARIYGTTSVDKISLHSCFIESRPVK